jgi:phage-related protein
MPSARLTVEFGEKGFSETKGKVSDLNEHVNKTGGFFKNAMSSAAGFIGANVVMGGVSMAANFLKDSVFGVVDAFGEAQVATALTNAHLKSTGGISGMTAESVGNLADSLAKMSGVDDEVIQSGENILLTFNNIRGETFPAATKAALDLSVALKQDMSSSATQLGKALQDPINGVTALRRVGVGLTDDQQKQIESFMAVNDIASAQKVILDELNNEYGDSAKNVGDTLPGALGKLHTAFGNIQEKVGGAVAPMLTDLANMFLDKVLPAVEDLGMALASNLVPILNRFGEFIRNNVIPDLISLAKWFNDHVVPILIVFWNVIQNDIVPQLESLNRKLMTELLPALQSLWNELSPILIPAFKFIGWVISNVVGPALSSLITSVSKVIGWIANFINWISHIGDAFSALGTAVHNIITGIQTIISNGFAFIVGIIQGSINFVVGIFQWLYEHNTYFQMLVDVIVNEFNRAKNFVTAIVTTIRNIIQDTWNTVVNGAKQAWKNFTDTIGSVVGTVGTAMEAIKSAVIDPIVNLGTRMFEIGKQLIQRFIDGIKDMAGAAKDAAGNILQGVGNFFGFHGLASGGTTPGGPVALAEQGFEIVASPGVYNVPKGYHVFNHQESVDMLNSGGKGDTYNIYPAQAMLTADSLAEQQRRIAVLYG